MKREIVKIDESLCDGCGLCVPECHEGALQIIDGKAKLISDLFCDGLGACLGHCPQGAITIEEREAEPYDEMKVMEYIVEGGNNVITAHLKHLYEHNELIYLKQAEQYLRDRNMKIPEYKPESKEVHSHGCPGAKEMSLKPKADQGSATGNRPTELRQWPIQLHLVSPYAQYYRDADLLLAADCVGFADPNFHQNFLKDKALAIACPKLDNSHAIYTDKLTAMINESHLKSITVIIMQVPCCSGLYQMAKDAVEKAERKIPLKAIVFGIEGEVIKETQSA